MSLPFLKPGDQVELVAPSSRCEVERLGLLCQMITAWGLQCVISPDLFGEDLLCANSDLMRFKVLKEALMNENNKAVFCVRGGYGSMRLIPVLDLLEPPKSPKLFLGMSDITSLNLYFMQKWKWPVLHAGLAPDYFTEETLSFCKSLILGDIHQMKFTGYSMNTSAQKDGELVAMVTGGNLTLVQASLGTLWQIKTENKFIFLEEVAERGYRIDRMLEHLNQAGVFKYAKGIILGDFTEGNEPNGASLIEAVLQRFAQSCTIPVIRIQGVGHDKTNFPFPLGTKATLRLGKNIKLTINR